MAKEFKKCKDCGESKLVTPDNFFMHLTIKTPRERRPNARCKPCDRKNRRVRDQKLYSSKPELHRKRSQSYKRSNPEKVALSRKKKYVSDRKNISFRIQCSLQTRLGFVARGMKKDRAPNLLGCTYDFFKKHLEDQFVEGMSWDNYGAYRTDGPLTWHIDHIIPCNSFNLETLEEQQKCFHYSNLQPLWAPDNISKSNKLDHVKKD